MQPTSENKAFLEMLRSAQARLEGRSRAALAASAGADYDAAHNTLSVSCLNRRYRFDALGFECLDPIDPWLHLVILHYLDLADGTPASDHFQPLGAMKDGRVRGDGFDRDADRQLTSLLDGRAREAIAAACEALGAEFPDTAADLSARFPLLPHCPMLLNIWLADDEFPLSGKLLISREADRCLTIEDAVTIGGFLLEALKAAL